MTSMWWFALPVLLLPIWWHRQKRERVKALPLATARFLPRAAHHNRYLRSGMRGQWREDPPAPDNVGGGLEPTSD